MKVASSNTNPSYVAVCYWAVIVFQWCKIKLRVRTVTVPGQVVRSHPITKSGAAVS